MWNRSTPRGWLIEMMARPRANAAVNTMPMTASSLTGQFRSTNVIVADVSIATASAPHRIPADSATR